MKATWRNYELAELRRRLSLVIDTAQGVVDNLKQKIDEDYEEYLSLPWWKRLIFADPSDRDWMSMSEDQHAINYARSHLRSLKALLERINVAADGGAYEVTLTNTEIGWLL